MLNRCCFFPLSIVDDRLTELAEEKLKAHSNDDLEREDLHLLA